MCEVHYVQPTLMKGMNNMRVFNYLRYEFSGKTEGLLNPQLLSGSRISATMSYEQTISFER